MGGGSVGAILGCSRFFGSSLCALGVIAMALPAITALSEDDSKETMGHPTGSLQWNTLMASGERQLWIGVTVKSQDRME